jgi:hypothetical protein
MIDFGKALGLELVRAPKKAVAAKKIGTTAVWLRKLAPLGIEALFNEEEIEIKALAVAVGSKTGNFAANALGAGTKGKGAGCFLRGVPSKLRLCRENAANLMPYIDTEEAQKALLAKLGVDLKSLAKRLRELPSAVEEDAKAQAELDAVVESLRKA